MATQIPDDAAWPLRNNGTETHDKAVRSTKSDGNC